MEILVNLDVMMAKRKISAGELAERHHARESVHSQKQQGEGHPLFHADGAVPRAAMPARRPSGICGRPQGR